MPRGSFLVGVRDQPAKIEESQGLAHCPSGQVQANSD